MTFKLKYRIAALAIAAAVLPVIVMAALTVYKEFQVESMVKERIRVLIDDSIRHIANDVYGMCDATNAMIQERLDSNLKVAFELLKQAGGLSVQKDELVKWKASDQFTRAETEVELPQFRVGGQPVTPNFDFNKRTPLVDDVGSITGATCTIFQRMNTQGDLLRIATSVEKLDGSRAVGTYIPAMDPDGKPNPVVSSIMAGQSYRGRAFVVNDWYLTEYSPLKDKDGSVIGCLYVGIRLNAISALSKMIKDTKVGKTGYIAVLGGQGDQRGRYVISKAGERDGENVIELKDADGKLYVKEMIDSAVKLKSGEVAFRTYSWLNNNESVPRQKTAALRYFEPWDWVIMSSTYADDYKEINEGVTHSMNELLAAVLYGAAAIMIFVCAIALYFGARIGVPIEKASSMARLIADGDIGSASEKLGSLSCAVGEDGSVDERALCKDETGALIVAIVAMTRNLNSLVGQVQRSIIQLASSATEIAASAKEQEAVVNEFGASTNEIVASSKEISATSQHLVASMGNVAEVSVRAAGLASEGHESLGEMEAMMGQLANATDSISSKLSVINEKANNINNVVTTITKVADQTNLLSLNAAIEAEKAGEFGKGFSVVAREVRRLADQTAVATLDITRMVKEMQSAVSSGVMEMDKFSEEVRHGVKDTGKISGQLAKIIEEVQSLPPVFSNVIDGMKQQSSGAQQISEAIVQLSDAVRQTSESLREFNQAVAQLNNATQGLQKEVSIFKVK